MIYGPPKKLPDGRYYLKIEKEDGGRVMHQMNSSKIVTRFDESEDNTIELSSAGVDRISAIDAEIITAAKENCQAWFGKQLAPQTLETAYTKSVKGVIMNVSKATVKNQVVTKVYSSTKECISSSELAEGVVCDVILELSGIWFMKKTFGPIWRIAQVKMSAPPKKLYLDEYLFQDEEEKTHSDEDGDYI